MNTCTTQKECEICPLLVGQTAADDNVISQTERWVAVLDRNQCYYYEIGRASCRERV